MALDELQVPAVGLELGRRGVQELVPHVGRRGQDRAAGVERGLRPARAHVPVRGGGVLVQEREVLGIHAELFGHERRHGHHRTAPVLLRPGHDRPAAVAVQMDVGTGGARHGGPPADRHADRLVLREVALVADHLDRALEGLSDADLVEDLACRTLGALLDQRPSAELHRVDAQLPRQLVHVLLQAPTHLGGGGSPDRARGLLVRVVEERLDEDVLDLVRAARVHRGHLPQEPALAAVRALVQDEPRLARHQAPVVRRAGLELHHDPLATLRDRPELLLAGEDQLHRAPRGARERGDLRLEMQIALGPEPPAQERDDDPDVRLGDLQGLRDTVACGIGNLRRGPDRDLVAPPLGEHGARLDRHALRGIGPVAALDDDVGLCHGGVGISLDDGVVAERVAVRHHVLVAFVRSPRSVDQRGIGLHRCNEVRDHRQRLVLHLDQARGLGGDRLGERGHACHDLSLEPHDVLGEQRSVLHEPPEPDVGQVLLRDHGDDPGQRSRPRGVDAEDPGVGVVGVAEPGVSHAGGREVGRVAPHAGHLLPAVGTDERRRCWRGAGTHQVTSLPVAHIMVRARWVRQIGANPPSPTGAWLDRVTSWTASTGPS